MEHTGQVTTADLESLGGTFQRVSVEASEDPRRCPEGASLSLAVLDGYLYFHSEAFVRTGEDTFESRRATLRYEREASGVAVVYDRPDCDGVMRFVRVD